MTNYEALIRDIDYDVESKESRRICDIISDILDDETGEIAIRIAKQYFPDKDIRDEEWVDNFVTPLQAKIQDQIMASLGFGESE